MMGSNPGQPDRLGTGDTHKNKEGSGPERKLKLRLR